MKTAIKLALLGATLAAGGAHAAIITNLPSVTGGSDLVLFVSDETVPQFFTQDLGNPLDSIYSKADVVSDGVLSSTKAFNTPTSIAGPDALLSTFLASRPAGDDIEWTILAADHTSTTSALGAQRALLTSTIDLTSGSPFGTTQTFTNNNVNTFALNLGTLSKFVNANYGTSNTNAINGWGDGSAPSDGKNAPLSWLNANVANGTAIGADNTQTMYMFGTNGAGLASNANIYVGGTVSIDASGNIVVTNAGGGTGGPVVPIPAAVWLLGSGLVGLMGVGRRKGAEAVPA